MWEYQIQQFRPYIKKTMISFTQYDPKVCMYYSHLGNGLVYLIRIFPISGFLTDYNGKILVTVMGFALCTYLRTLGEIISEKASALS